MAKTNRVIIFVAAIILAATISFWLLKNSTLLAKWEDRGAMNGQAPSALKNTQSGIKEYDRYEENLEQYRVDYLVRRLPGRYGNDLIRRAIQQGDFRAEDLEKLDFSLPEDPNHDPTSNYSVVRLLNQQQHIKVYKKPDRYYGNRG